MKTRFIINPRSGRAYRAIAQVQAFAAETGAEIALTAHPRHATELASLALAEGCELIVAVGGDGTLNEVAASLVGTSSLFGLIPCGSGNGLGRNLGIHGSVKHALEILRTGQPRTIDTGLADGHPFFTAAGLGFEADVSARFNQLVKRGFIRYISTSASLWRQHAPETVTIEHAGGKLSTPAFTLAVANCDQYGNQAFIAPGARVDDGLLDLTVVPSASFLRGPSLLVRLFAGSIGRAAGVQRLQSARFIVERQAPGLIHTDGETHSAGQRVEFTIRAASLRVLVPSGLKAR